MPLNFSPRRWFKHIQTMKRASKMGVFRVRKARSLAHLELMKCQQKGWKRLWEEVEWFSDSKHRFESISFS